ncbi:MAG: serine hydrolase domain-containing protein [Saprospiraceae bacterium]|nr:beta-lactamase family protein [Lewinella sp.]
MKNCRLISLLIICLLLANCKEHKTSVAERMQKELDNTVSSKFAWTPGVSLSVYAPEDAIIWTGTAGVSDLDNFSNFHIDQPFRIASVAKTFVAAAILRLQEEGQLSIEDPISQFISDHHLQLLEADGYQINKITIRHCLDHTSGLYDYVFGSSAHPSPYIAMIRAQTEKKWTRTEQLEGAVRWGAPLGPPGQSQHYGDTGYILLGEILETITGLNLGDAVEQLIDYEKIGLTSTWMETVQPPKNALPLVRCYYDRIDFSQVDASVDLFGGGGLISTTADLSRFFYHLFRGNVFQREETLEEMLSLPPSTNVNELYGLGIKSVKAFGHFIHGHDGLWDTFAYYSPENKAAIAIHFTDGGNDYLIKRVISILDQYQESR